MTGPIANPTKASAAAANRLVWILFLSLALMWGSSFAFIKIGLDEGMGPFTLVSFRLLIGAAFLVVVMRLTHRRLPRAPGAMRRLLTLAVLNIAIPFLLLAWGEQWITSAVTGIFNSLTPMFAIVLAAVVLRDEPITLNRLGGIALGFLGAVLLASPNLSAGSGTVDTSKALLGQLAVAAACLSYACGAVYTRLRISGQPLVLDPEVGARAAHPVEIALPQVGIAAILTWSWPSSRSIRPAARCPFRPALTRGWRWPGWASSARAWPTCCSSPSSGHGAPLAPPWSPT